MSITVVGIWFNDSTAGVGVWCDTCKTYLVQSDESLTLDEIRSAADGHTHEV